MTEALKCPSCAAPLDAPPGNAATMRCPYCNTTVILRNGSTASNDATADASPFGPAIGNALHMAEIVALIRAGNKIGAIRLYRQIHGSDLASAKDAVDKIAAGQFSGSGVSVQFDPALRSTVLTATSVASKSAGLGCGLAVGIFVFVIIIIMVAFRFSIRPQSTRITPAWTPPTIGIPNLPPALRPAPAASAFADATLTFGSEGIGAGQFKDSRSVAVDTTGKIYVAEYSDGRVQIFDPAGKFLSMFTLGKENSVMNLACDHQGNLFICTAGKITRYDLATHIPQNVFQQSTEENSYSPEEYMDVFAAVNGNIYSVSGSHIIVLNPKGEIQNIYKEADKIGEDVDFFRVAVSGEGDIYALDRSKGIFKFSSDGRYINRFGGGEGYGPGYVSTAHGLAIDGQGRLYVACSTPAVQVFDANGRYLDSFGGNEVCFGLAITDQNEIFGCFRNQYCVKKFVVNKKDSQTP